MGRRNQFLLLLWKNYVIQKRKVFVTILEVALPTLFSLILIFIRLRVTGVPVSNGVVWDYCDSFKDYPPINASYDFPRKIVYSPDVPVVRWVMRRVDEIIPNLSVECSSPPNLSQASVSAPSTLVGSKATYTCYTGYYMSGTGYITCLTGAVWSTVNFQCNIKDCGTPSTVTYSTSQYYSTTYLSTVTYTCNTGYDMSGTNRITCLASGSWSTVLFQCVPRDCGTPPSFSYGSASYSSTTYGSSAAYNCDSGKTMYGSNSIQCEASGSWSSTSAYCGCGGLPSQDGAHINSGSYHIGTSRSYSCSKSGHTCTGDGYIHCQPSGSWTSPGCSCIYTIISFGG